MILGFGYFLDWFFRFLYQNTSVFQFWCSLRFADFSFFSFWLASGRFIWSVSNVPPVPATEETIVDCVVFFHEKGKSGKNLRKKNTFRCRVKREERSLEKPKDTKRYEGFRQVHGIHKYFHKVSLSAVCAVCPTCRHGIGF